MLLLTFSVSQRMHGYRWVGLFLANAKRWAVLLIQSNDGGSKLYMSFKETGIFKIFFLIFGPINLSLKCYWRKVS